MIIPIGVRLDLRAEGQGVDNLGKSGLLVCWTIHVCVSIWKGNPQYYIMHRLGFALTSIHFLVPRAANATIFETEENFSDVTRLI